MNTPNFQIKKEPYSIEKNELIALIYLNSKTPLFNIAQYKALHSVKISSLKPGSSNLAYVQRIDNCSFAVNISLLDDKKSNHKEEIKKIIPTLIKQASKLNCKKVIIPISSSFSEYCEAIYESIHLGLYSFDKYKKNKSLKPTIILVSNLTPKTFSKQKIITQSVNFARDILNEPPCTIYPETLAKACSAFAKGKGLKVSIWDEKRLNKEKCQGILSVGKGSSNPPRLLMGKYSHTKPSFHLTLVGKGITFDSGGYSLKPSKSQEEMKFDMAGAAMMWSAACAIAALKMKIKLTVLCPIAHNAISGKAYNVSDIVTSRNGSTIEVLNTDAEGRIVLADALCIACEEKPDLIIDSATLTGAAVVALGEDIAALYGNCPKQEQRIIDASLNAGEHLWRMPLHSDYNSLLESKIADIKNTGGRWAGSITAALFLNHFIEKKQDWMHLDIAGPGCKMRPLDYLGHGAKGFGVRTIVEFASTL